MDCARAIVQSGIKLCIMDVTFQDKHDTKWIDMYNRTFELFRECKVIKQFYDGSNNLIRTINIRLNGEDL